MDRPAAVPFAKARGRSRDVLASGVLLVFLSVSSAHGADHLVFIDVESVGLENVSGTAVSPDGAHVYAQGAPSVPKWNAASSTSSGVGHT